MINNIKKSNQDKIEELDLEGRLGSFQLQVFLYLNKNVFNNNNEELEKIIEDFEELYLSYSMRMVELIRMKDEKLYKILDNTENIDRIDLINKIIKEERE